MIISDDGRSKWVSRDGRQKWKNTCMEMPMVGNIPVRTVNTSRVFMWRSDVNFHESAMFEGDFHGLPVRISSGEGPS